jgi:hypothetical protein
LNLTEKLLLKQYNGEIRHEMIVDCTNDERKKKEKQLNEQRRYFSIKTLA